MTLSLDEFLGRFLLHVPICSVQRRRHSKDSSGLWLCPKCGGPMTVIERRTAAETQLRSPPAQGTVAARNDSLPQQIFACLSALSLSAPCHSANRALLLSQALFWYESCAFVTYSPPALVCRALPHSLGASRHRTIPPLNLHKARVRRNHGRLRSNGSIERAQTTVPALTHS